MGTRDPRVDAYIAKSADFAKPVLKHLRELVHKNCPDTNETIKWSMPFFEYKGGVFCNFASFKQHCAFGFWLGPLLEVEAKNAKAMGDFGRITSMDDLPSDKEIVRLMKAAMKLHDSGAKVPGREKKTEKPPLEVPPAFLAAVKKNKKALATFESFSPSKQKEYVEWFTEAKTEATREKRLMQSIEWMAEGKSRHWKYQNC